MLVIISLAGFGSCFIMEKNKMVIIDCNNRKTELPVSVLNQNVFDLYIQIVNAEKKERAYFEDIPLDYFITRNVDFQVVNNEIWASEIQCQILWNCSYALAISEQYYQNGIIGYDAFIQRALDLLAFDYSDWKSELDIAYLLPNPAVYSSLEYHYVDKANSYYKNGLRFILYHEFEHIQQNKHQNNDDSDFEALADSYAVKRLSKDFISNSVPINGLESSMLYFMLLQKGEIDCNSAHGNLMDRFLNIAEQFEDKGLLPCLQWQVLFAIWIKLYGFKFIIPGDSSIKSLRQFINLIKKELKSNKNEKQ